MSIEGVDFKPYVEILLRRHEGASVADRLVVVTDGDPRVPGNRKADLEEMASQFGSGDNLCVYINERTLEHELFAAGNEKLLKFAFLAIHRNSKNDWETQIENIPTDGRPNAFISLLQAKRTRKGDLAQEIASRIAKGAPMSVPTYLEQAIRSLVVP